ncbi:MAG: DUF5752 family protein [Candidatus Marinimicrobia bacterium]|nr:DUF5752 family protein [Candidatus Neomarinimicrobiota bacterium]MCF7828042.1 DUF5752 family protein [Candidatus Neomarinimicrobiota bacterium]MCF7879203.1 DUF5752 family protein [Candidatus Neomarinimicrobiota bacterium]
MANSFEFYTEAGLTKYTGFKADSLRSLIDGLEGVSGSSIFYHLHHALFRWHFETGGHLNDFARWSHRQLQEDLLAEKLSSVDPLSYTSISQARNALIQHIEDHIGSIESLPRVPRGREFYFTEIKSFIVGTGDIATDLKSFRNCIANVESYSLFYHLIEARVRMSKETNDFSVWLRDELDEQELAEKIEHLSPYVYNLYEIRSKLLEMIEERLDDRE